MNEHYKRLTEEERREQDAYQALVKASMPRSRTLSQCVVAFAVGGAICCLGQLVGDLGAVIFSFGESDRAAFTAVVLIFLGALATGLGVYDKLGAIAGAGSVVPITGFANSIVSPAMEHRREGLVMGVGAQLFTIAGPVLVYGITASVVVGVITCVADMLK